MSSYQSKLSLFISSLDICSRILLIPWSFLHLQLSLSLSVSRAISIYGLLFSSFSFGRVLGKNIFLGSQGQMTSRLGSFVMIMMSISFLLLGITSRISIICLCYFMIGFCGGIIRICYGQEDELLPLVSPAITKNLLISPSNQIISTPIEPLALIFIPLFAGITYNSAATSRFPALIPCLAAAIICIFVLCYQCFNQRRICWMSGKQSLVSRQKGTKSIQKNSSSQNLKKKINIVDIDNVNPPQEFLDLCYGDREAAKKKYHKTLLWKAENGVDSLLETPQATIYCDIFHFFL
jgi:MFS family permease